MSRVHTGVRALYTAEGRQRCIPNIHNLHTQHEAPHLNIQASDPDSDAQDLKLEVSDSQNEAPLLNMRASDLT